MSSADKSDVSGVLLSKTSRALSRASNDRNWMSDSNFAYKKYHVPWQVPSSCMCRKKCWNEENWIKIHNPVGFVIFLPRRYLHFTFFFLDSIKLLPALQLHLPQSPHSLLKPLTMLFFSSKSHHAKEQSQTLQTGVNSQNYSRATTNSPAPNWMLGMTVEALALQTRVYELQL